MKNNGRMIFVFVLFLVLLFLSFNVFSTFRMRVLHSQLGFLEFKKGTFTPFKEQLRPIMVKTPPKLLWKKQIDSTKEIHFIDKIDLSVSQNGEIYIYILYSYIKNISRVTNWISADGQKAHFYEKEPDSYHFINNDKFVFSDKGNKKSITYQDSSGKKIWQREGQMLDIGPDNYFYGLMGEDVVFSCDSKGKIRWTFQIPIKNVNINFSRIASFFFDYQSNLHLIAKYNDVSLVHYTISSEYGLLQADMPKTMFSYHLGINDKGFSEVGVLDEVNQYKNSIFSNSLRVLYNDGIDRKILSYDFKGNIRWEYLEPDGLYQSMYTLDSNETMYLVYQPDYKEKSYLQAISKKGKLVWEVDIGPSQSTNPFVDISNHIFIGNQVNIGGCSFPAIHYFDDAGNLLWKWIANENLKNCFIVSDLTVNSDGSIFFVVKDKNQKLYCVKLSNQS